MLSINEIRNGQTLLVDDGVYVVIETQHVKPGKGAAFARVRLKNLKTGLIQEKTFRGNEKIEQAFVEERKLQYLYHSGNFYNFMDQENYEEVALSEDAIGESKKFLKDNLEVEARFFNGTTLSIILPNFVVFQIEHCEPGVRGDTAKASTKPAKIETGAVIQVPLFINQGEKIKIDTRTGQYVERC
ncbi:MAG: elongation factor P [Candidatus Omnitrophota bacterium]